jgi:hypothetical protein
MNLRHIHGRIVSSILGLGIIVSLAGVGTHSVAAQSVTATTPFPFCVNHQEYPSGRYRFTLISNWLLSIRNVNGGGESLFEVQPEAGTPRGLSSGPVGSVGGITFRNIQGLRELRQVHEAGSDVSFELVGQRIPRDKLRSRGPLDPINCFSEKSSIRARNTGQ